MRIRVVAAAALLALPHAIRAQHQDVAEKPSIWNVPGKSAPDSTSLLSAFQSGSLNGHFRYFFMQTDNRPGLSDYYAHAAGGGLRYESSSFHGFRVGISGFYIFNLASSDLGVPDAATQAANRYEAGLFNVEHPGDHGEISRLEELLVRYSRGKSEIQVGKMLLNSPLINLQDGRMRPTGVEGIWLDVREIAGLRIEGGWLYSFSPRGTTRWFRGAHSIGVYPQGRHVDGSRARYQGNLRSAGTAVLGLRYTPSPRLRFQAWSYFIDQIQHTVLVQADLMPSGAGSPSAARAGGFFGGIQLLRQDAVKSGGNPDPALSYLPAGARSMAAGIQAGWSNGRWESSLSYTRITSHGRFLFPREWGREPFYTFMPRERNEGAADVHASVAKVQYRAPGNGFSASVAGGYFHMPDVRDSFRNKYGMPSYFQVNTDLRYTFHGMLQGLEAQLLVVAKRNNGNTYGDLRNVINKVDMLLYNFVLNYRF